MKLAILFVILSLPMEVPGGPVAIAVSFITAIAPIIPDIVRLVEVVTGTSQDSQEEEEDVDQMQYVEDVLHDLKEGIDHSFREQNKKSAEFARSFADEIKHIKRRYAAQDDALNCALLDLEIRVSVMEGLMRDENNSKHHILKTILDAVVNLGKHEMSCSNKNSATNTASGQSQIIHKQNIYNQQITYTAGTHTWHHN